MKTHNIKRLEQIAKLYEESKLTFEQIGKILEPPITKQSVYEAYERYKTLKNQG